MIGTIAGWLIARNPALTLAHAKRLAKVGLIAAGIVIVVVGFIAWDYFDDKAAIEQADSKRKLGEAEDALKGERRARQDDAKAAKRREENRIKNEGTDDARQEAIDNAPDDTTDAAGRALACERLRQAGLDTPAACG